MKLLQKLGSIEVVSKNGVARKRGQGLFLCPVCDQEVVRPLDNGTRSDSCGAVGCKKTTEVTHAHSGKRLYNIWNDIRIRCDRASSRSFKDYGAKGISYPERWKTFEGFFMDMGMSYIDGMTIDRKDSKKSYSKENCHWIPLEENCSKEKQKPVAKYTPDGVFITRYPSVQAAVEAEGFKFNSSIAKVARGERKQYQGFIWKYL